MSRLHHHRTSPWDAPQYVLKVSRKMQGRGLTMGSREGNMTGPTPPRMWRNLKTGRMTRILLDWSYFTPRTSSYARLTGGQSGVLTARIGREIAHITVAVLDVVFLRWITSVLGMWQFDMRTAPGSIILLGTNGMRRVGGPIGENNFKFFLQFTMWAAVYCAHLVVVTAYYVHRQIITEVMSIDK